MNNFLLSDVAGKMAGKDNGTGVVLRKLFIGPFYKQHAGTFLFLYVLFLGSFMFINYLGKMSSSDSFFWHFILMIFMVTHQFMVMLFLVLAIFYLIKSRLFIKALLQLPAYGFLRDSLGAVPQKTQWWHWCKVQFFLSLPLLVYGLACLGMSLFKGVPLYGIVIMVFLIVGILVTCSLNYYDLLRVPKSKQVYKGSFIKVKWNLTRWVAFMYATKRLTPALLITKFATIFFTLLMIHWQTEEVMTSRQWWLSFLLIGAAHVLLVFKTSLFMETHFNGVTGLPMGFMQGFFFAIGRSYSLLLLPELLILLVSGNFGYALIGCSSVFIMLFFYHYFAAYLGFNLKALLKSGFLLLCLAFVMTLYGIYGLVILGYLLIAVVLYGRRYYCLQ